MFRWWSIAVLSLALALGCDSADPINVDLKVVRVDVAPADQVLVVGDTMRLTAYPKTADGTIVGSAAIAWESENDGIASVRASGGFGVVEAKAVGITRIRALVDGKMGDVIVNVTEQWKPVAAIEITPANPTITINGSVQLEAKLRAADGTVLGGRAVTWTSSHGPTATVTSTGNPTLAVVSGQAAGEVVITARSEGIESTARVRVQTTQVPVGYVALTPGTLGAFVNQQMNYAGSAIVLSANGLPLQGRTVTWSVSDTTIARMSPTGELQALRKGSTQVKATSEGVSGTATLVVFERPQGISTQYGLTWDWWNGEIQVAVTVAKANFTDVHGNVRQVNLFIESSTFTIDKFAFGNNWSQELVLSGYVDNGTGQMQRIEQRISDHGTFEQDPLTAAPWKFTSSVRPGYAFTGHYRGYEFHLFQAVGIASTIEYRYRLPIP